MQLGRSLQLGSSLHLVVDFVKMRESSEVSVIAYCGVKCQDEELFACGTPEDGCLLDEGKLITAGDFFCLFCKECCANQGKSETKMGKPRQK